MGKTASEDTEITLGTGKLLALFFGLVALCAVFFSLGFSFGKAAAFKLAAPDVASASTVTTASGAALRPSAVKITSATADASVPDTASKNAADAPAPTAAPQSTPGSPSTASAPGAPADPAVAPALNSYYVQVAAVSKQEDADALVDALKKKQYPAFSANSAPDKLFHVQVGPYADVKDAEVMRSKLVGDGYNPILKK